MTGAKAALAGFAAGLMGGAVATLLVLPNTPSDIPSEQPIDERLLDRMEALGAAIERLAEAQAAPGSVAGEALRSPQRDLAPATTDPRAMPAHFDSELLDRLDRLLAVLESAPIRVGLATAPRLAPQPDDGTSRVETVLERLRAGEISNEELQGTMAAEHRFWTLEDLVRRYGQPAHASASPNGVRVRFETGDPLYWSIHFDLVDGIVIDSGMWRR